MSEPGRRALRETSPGAGPERARLVSSGQSIYWPQPVRVRTAPGGQPAAVDSVAVDAVREEWLVEDRWWTERPRSLG